MGTGLSEDAKTSMLNPDMRHCLSCKDSEIDINALPCRTCLHTEPVGRARPLWSSKTSTKKGIRPESQQCLF